MLKHLNQVQKIAGDKGEIVLHSRLTTLLQGSGACSTGSRLKPLLRPLPIQTGFSLIELLAVITLLAILSTAALLSYDGVDDEARADLVRHEMAEIRKALLQFRRDTGELPCRVYRDGDFVPDKNTMTTLDFNGLPFTPTVSDYHNWCINTFTGQRDNGLSMLFKFPYDDTDASYMPLLWNRDSKRGWNGPYLHDSDNADPWGNRYILVDPELDYGVSYRCKENISGDYDVTGGLYSCVTPTDPDWGVNHTLDANIARLVSVGPDGVYAGLNAAEPCQAAAGSDDVVLCLLR